MTDEQLRLMFGFQQPTQDQAKCCVAVRTHFWHLGRLLIASTEPGRARDVAVTALQQACWAAVAAVVESRRAGGARPIYKPTLLSR